MTETNNKGQHHIKQEDTDTSVCYFRTVAADGKCTYEIRSQIDEAKQLFYNINKILTNKISLKVRKRISVCCIEPVLLHDCKIWSVNTQMTKKLKAVEIRYWRKMHQIAWAARETDEDVLRQVSEEQNLVTVQ